MFPEGEGLQGQGRPIVHVLADATIKSQSTYTARKKQHLLVR